MKKIKEAKWKTRPISCTCEVMRGQALCDLTTVAAYPAWGGGWMALCKEHAKKHTEATNTDDLIKQGETWC